MARALAWVDKKVKRAVYGSPDGGGSATLVAPLPPTWLTSQLGQRGGHGVIAGRRFAGGLAATDKRLVPYGAMTATFYTGLGCLLGPSLMYFMFRAVMGG